METEKKKVHQLVQMDVPLDRRTAAMLQSLADAAGIPAPVMLRRIAVKAMKDRTRKKTT